MNHHLRPGWVVFAGLVALSLAACGFPSSDAAVVNGDPITISQLDDQLPAVKTLQGVSGGTCGSSPAGEVPVPGAEDEACTRDALALLIQWQILKELAEERDALPTADDVSKLKDQFVQQAGGEEGFAAALKQSGATPEQVDALLRQAATLNTLHDAFDTSLTDAELQKAYDQNRGDFATIDTAHILLPTQAQANEVKADLTTENFHEVAKKVSQDTATGAKGGELGPVTAGQLVPEYSNAVLAGEPGQIIGPIKSQFGYHLIWIHDIKDQSLDQVADQVRAIAFQDFVLHNIDNAKVQVNPRFGTWEIGDQGPEIVPPAAASPLSTVPAGVPQSGIPPAPAGTAPPVPAG